jgi:hypothetical protein
MGAALPDGHGQGIEDQLRPQMGCHRQPDDPATPRIQHDGLRSGSLAVSHNRVSVR